jgi:hypothetical protein
MTESDGHFNPGTGVYEPNAKAYWWYKDQLYRMLFQITEKTSISYGDEIDNQLRDMGTYKLRWDGESKVAYEMAVKGEKPETIAKFIYQHRITGVY